jgi:putative addiction module component (TIGR02574 family)
MSERARKLLEEVLGLSTSERAEMAAALLATLPPGHALDEEDPDPEWVAEIERRARAAMADPDGGIPWETAREGILAALRSRRQ